jgi:uncharacterized membrane protein YgdD (TMEM256/DUF423 family)
LFINDDMKNIFALLGSISALLGVALGAFGAHALKQTLSPAMLAVFETGVRYQMYHSFALLVTAWAVENSRNANFSRAGWAFVAGIILFSGSLYALTLTDIQGFGLVTPVGGAAFLAGWLLLAVGFWKQRRSA